MKKVLVADGNSEELRNTISDAFKHLGLNPTTASSARTALAIFESALARGEPFDLIIVDFDLPAQGGIWLAAQIRNLSEKVDIALMSNAADDEVTHKAINAAIILLKLRAPLIKPFAYVELEALVSSCGAAEA